ncbi:aminoacyl-tRNA hydrolase [candidate division KSB1 bacterium]|jgi:PTH1 family peptidyl-tRNA hydrolase|nr:aminoacyl-tRNA hydrolase [candidate division KSB1 bacterium]
MNPTETSPALIVGLGNPGWRYKKTRHNIGFMVIDRLRKKLSVSRKRHDLAKIWTGDKNDVTLAKPTTFMNASGMAVEALLEESALPVDRCLIVYDDLDLPLGKIRIRAKGSAGGHRGVASIIDYLETEHFPRLRCGIRTAEINNTDTVSYVLGRFKKTDRDSFSGMIDQAVRAVEMFISDGLEKSMNQYNRIQKDF